MVREMAHRLDQIAKREAAGKTFAFRFVGGPLHNRLLDVPAHVRIYTREFIVDDDSTGYVRRGTATYRRLYFRSQYFDTLYEQFVHSSLIDGDGLPVEFVSGERFAPVPTARQHGTLQTPRHSEGPTGKRASE